MWQHHNGDEELFTRWKFYQRSLDRIKPVKSFCFQPCSTEPLSVIFPLDRKITPKLDLFLRVLNNLSTEKLLSGARSLVWMESFGGEDASVVAPLNQWRHDASRIFQYYLDRVTPLPYYRWLGTIILAAIYVLRVYYVQGFYVVSYGLGIYILNLLIGFLSPLVDPEMGNSEEALLPMKGSDEFKPFIRRLPEFKFWYAITKAFCIAFVLTFFSMFDVPVFWPILLCYWMVLFVLTMRRQISHMIKYKYVPFNIGKQKYGGKKSSSGGRGSRGDWR